MSASPDLRAPADVVWHVDGFSIELGRLRRPCAMEHRTRHVWVLTIPLYLLGLVAEVSIAGAVFVLGSALVLFARQAMWFDQRRMDVRTWELRIGRRRVRAHALLGCDLRGRSLVVRTISGTWPLDVAGLPEPERAWLRAQVEALVERWRARSGEPPEMIHKLVHQDSPSRRRIVGLGKDRELRR